MVAAAAVAASLAATVPTPAASAAAVPRRLVAMRWAEAQAGKPYIFGATGPGGFDCSGLVQQAYARAGIRLPRTTYQMLADGAQLRRIPRALARFGDIVFYGPGHVELYFGNDVVPKTFGAHASGTLVGPIRWGGSWHPTAFFRVAGAG
jgi:cell wall-associated NlpC family hydrolase